MWVLYVLIVVIILTVNYIIAKQFSDIAELKGHEGSIYFWFTFTLGIAGMLMVVALPDMAARQKTATQAQQKCKVSVISQNTRANSVATHSWRCDHCGQMATKSPCEHCGK